MEEGSTRRLYLMHLPRRCIPLLNARWCWTVLFILIVGEATTYSICKTLSISRLTTPYFLQTKKSYQRRRELLEPSARQGMLAYLRGRQNVICTNSMVFPRSILDYFERNVSGVFTPVTRHSNYCS